MSWPPNGVGNLPAQLTSFVGRDSELSEVKRLVGVSRLLTLTGVGGVGKTRLALRAAADLSDSFADGVWVAELSNLEDPDLVAHTISVALGLTDQTVRPQMDVLADDLSDKELLLIIDGVEHVAATCSEVVTAVLRAAPAVRVVATSRQPIAAPGEHGMLVHPLPVPDPQAPSPDNESMMLFTHRAAAVAPGFSPTTDNLSAVARLCRWLDGIPLAIELAAARLRALPMEVIVDRLDDRFPTAHRWWCLAAPAAPDAADDDRVEPRAVRSS